jgi:crotonobetainyl-CoA:carnitine CoA-transferase CaiB-like acyl-CoA transferase
MASAALEGIRVIDFGQYMAGPMAAMMLADFGADVIRIDPPDGPRLKTAANATWNRGKRSIVLDLKKPEDLATAKKLIESADVVIENFRPGVMDRLGLGQQAMRALNPRLVYCAIPGFAHDDPRAGMPAWEGVLGAATACYTTHALVKVDHPIYNCLPFSSAYGAYMSAVAIALALNARDRSGKGQFIEVPLFAATFSAFSGKAVRVIGEKEKDPLTSWRYALCKDGRWFIYVPRDTHATFFRDLGLPEKPNDQYSEADLLKRIDEMFASRSSEEWETWCAEQGVEGGVCRTSAEWMEHPLALRSEIIREFDDPQLGRFKGPGLYTRLSLTPGVVRSPRPTLDQHREQILGELAAPRQQPAFGNEFLRSALQGVRVLDLGIILAIPSTGRTLAEYGADIIKIDSPHRNPVSWHNDINRAKRSILLDLKAKEGKEIFWKLLETADVVIENFRSGVADKLGIGYKDVSARRPDIIYASVNAFGQTGEYTTRPGREVLIQAITGMEMRYGGTEPAQNPFNSNDYATGLASTFGIAMAMMHRRRTGKGQWINSALIYSATMLQSGMMQAYEGRRVNEPGGLDCLGESPIYRCYEASDGWLFMGAREGDLARCPALADLASLSGKPLESALEQRFRTRTIAEWVKLLVAADIGATRVVRQIGELMEDPLVISQGLSLKRPHDEIGMVVTTGPGIRLSETPLVPGRPAPKPGIDAASILGEIGMADQLERLIREGVVRTDGVVPGGAS